MGKIGNKAYFIFAGAIFVLLLLVSLLNIANDQHKTREESVSTVREETQAADIYSYTGETGKDALTLLSEQTPVETDAAGLVVAVNNRRVDSSKKEFWAFYVNGKMAQSGPADYQTQDGDQIEWKIERYR